MRHWLILALFSAFAVGCSDGPRLAAVSGQVKLNGKPLPNAHITTQPRGSSSAKVGVGSVGVTDEDGHYSLATINGDKGAVVGPHMVFIRTNAFREIAPTSDKDPKGGVKKELIPARYNDNTELELTVPADGTDTADFDLKSP